MNYAAALNTLRAELSQEQFCLLSRSAPKWAVANIKSNISRIEAEISKIADLAFTFGGR